MKLSALMSMAERLLPLREMAAAVSIGEDGIDGWCRWKESADMSMLADMFAERRRGEEAVELELDEEADERDDLRRPRPPAMRLLHAAIAAGCSPPIVVLRKEGSAERRSRTAGLCTRLCTRFSAAGGVRVHGREDGDFSFGGFATYARSSASAYAPTSDCDVLGMLAKVGLQDRIA